MGNELTIKSNSGKFNERNKLVLAELTGCGATTILYKLKQGPYNQQLILPYSTIGCDFGHVEYKNTNTNRRGMGAARERLWSIVIADGLRDAVILVLANKQDLPDAMTVQEVSECLDLNKLITNEWHIQGTCALTGEGLYEGLSATTIFYKLKQGPHIQQPIKTPPTIGLDFEHVEYNNVGFIIFDLGGGLGGMINRLDHCKRYFTGAIGLMLVVDSSSRESMGAARERPWSILTAEELRDAVVLVLANKQDLPDVMTVHEVSECLYLDKLTTHMWHIQGTCALTGEGLYEGLDWIIDTCAHSNKQD
ncbi:unnamed protein product [Oppiella nova]|uniref:small monomeric GTPase n=1 Tax=Oppiella nova TaxID=334625 RepID=A0A7R9LWL1_9ACAR|nr:unnamed protein product [Oppiella nova]CAG2167709.1 unnamed protein product [Oppiella nova]